MEFENQHLHELVLPNQTVPDPRRFKIYFSVNQTDTAFRVSNLTIRDYIRLKSNDAIAVEYCKKHFAPTGVHVLYRSLDDVEYLPVPINE